MEHLPLLLGLLVLGLIIFGPQKMIAMAGSIGRMLRELQMAMKEMNWNMLGEDAKPGTKPATLGMLSQLAQDMTAAPTTTTMETPSPAAVVESSSDESSALAEQPPVVASEAPREQ